ncbi:MAG: hypothetical protein F4Y01_06595 [Gammaproteobacteria bacterium]|nr:hypothetical protein [Gammaproteobacteria bacterium]
MKNRIAAAVLAVGGIATSVGAFDAEVATLTPMAELGYGVVALGTDNGMAQNAGAGGGGAAGGLAAAWLGAKIGGKVGAVVGGPWGLIAGAAIGAA